MFVMGPCRHNGFRTSPWQLGTYGVVDGLGPHRPSPFMKRLGVQALGRIRGAGPLTARPKLKP